MRTVCLSLIMVFRMALIALSKLTFISICHPSLRNNCRTRLFIESLNESSSALADPLLSERSLSQVLRTRVDDGQAAAARDASSAGASAFPFTLENECRPGSGEAGWLGAAAVHGPSSHVGNARLP